LRDDPGSRGLVTAISGMITKQGVSVWSTEPPGAGYRYEDVSAAAAGATREVPTADGSDAVGTILTYTVNADDEGPRRSIAVVDLGDGTRALVASDDRALAAHLVGEDAAGVRAHVGRDESFTLA